jgi:hypothetical protein
MTSSARGAEVVDGPSASDSSAHQFKDHAASTGGCVHARANCRGLNSAGQIYTCQRPELPSPNAIARCKIFPQSGVQFEEIVVESDHPSMPPILEERNENLAEVNTFLRAVRGRKIQNIFAAVNRLRVMRSVRMLDEVAVTNASDPAKGWMGFQLWMDNRPRPVVCPSECVRVVLERPRPKDSCNIILLWAKAEDLPRNMWCGRCGRGLHGCIRQCGVLMTDRFRGFLVNATSINLDFWTGDISD